MVGIFSSLAAAALLALSQQGGEDPRTVVHTAVRAVEGDSVPAVRARWDERLRRDAGDRAAALGLATLARLGYDYPEAGRRYRALAAAPATVPDRYATYARLGMAWGATQRGEDVEAEAEFEGALRDARARGDGATEAEALIGAALLRAAVRGVDVGFATLDSARRRIPPDAPDLTAEWHIRRGVLHAVGMDGRRAAADVEAAVAAARRAGALRLEARALRTAGHAMLLRSELDSATALFREAERLQRRARDRSALAETFLRHATAAGARGDLPELKRVLEAAIVEARASHNVFALDGAYVGLGMLSMQVHDYPSAAEHFSRAEAGYRARGSIPDVMTVTGWQANLAQAVGDLPRARQLSEERRAFARQVGDASEEFLQHRQLAWIALRAGDTAAARRALDDAIMMVRERQTLQWLYALTIERGRLALARGDFDAAERFFRAYLAGTSATEHLQRQLGQTQLAELYARRGGAANLARAERELAAAGDALDRWRATLTDRELRTLSFQANPREHGDRDAGTAVVIAALAAGGRGEGAFALAERRRARELADRMTRAVGLAGAGSDVSSAAAGYLRGRATAADVAAALPDERTALLEYVAGAYGAPTTLFAVTRAPGGGARVQAWVLPPADSLAPRIGRFVALLENGSEPRVLARELGATLLDPALGTLDPRVTRLVIVPDGPLHRLPFDALRLADGRYAVERFAVGFAPSAAIVTALWRRERAESAGPAARPLRLLALGDPAFAGESGRLPDGDSDGYRAAFAAGGGLPRLTESGREARAVARYAGDGAVVRLRADASESYLKQASLGAFRVIHFATHAVVDERSAARTALALAPGGGESGFVGPGDLAALRLDADLVVLSACRSAGGVVVDGEGVQGLTAPLLQAGARSVVATRWRIGDRGTVPFVEAFYRGLAGGRPAADALRAAKLDGVRRGAAPAEWAAFAVVGDPLVTVPLTPPRRPWWPAGATIALAVAMPAVVVYARRRRAPAARNDEQTRTV